MLEKWCTNTHITCSLKSSAEQKAFALKQFTWFDVLYTQTCNATSDSMSMKCVVIIDYVLFSQLLLFWWNRQNSISFCWQNAISNMCTWICFCLSVLFISMIMLQNYKKWTSELSCKYCDYLFKNIRRE